VNKTKPSTNDEIVVAESFRLSDLWKKEDWLSIWIAFVMQPRADQFEIESNP